MKNEFPTFYKTLMQNTRYEKEKENTNGMELIFSTCPIYLFVLLSPHSHLKTSKVYQFHVFNFIAFVMLPPVFGFNFLIIIMRKFSSAIFTCSNNGKKKRLKANETSFKNVWCLLNLNVVKYLLIEN